MLADITIGQYVAGDSFLHRLDPRTKIGMTTVFVVVMFVIRTWWGYLAGALAVAASLAVARLSPRWVLRGLRPIVVLIAISTLLNAFWTEGTVIWEWGPLHLTAEGLNKAAMLGVRLVLLVAGAAVLTLTTSPIDLTDALQRLLRPTRRLGVPAHELAMMMSIALRFVPTLMEEADRIMKAQMARGAAFDRGGLVARARSLIPLLVPLFVSAFRRADELALAMEARCYRGGEGRTKFRVLHMARADWTTLVLFTAAAAGVAVWL
ncbi:energy-coupling factor transporter transmembrane component T family protein [Carboxydichorda subterranea]|uniref:energy-coupling factor transporter transmembrane component T family protein n=1 Tax=Carboxydichorda subterranea TaxID=3109565 RepID=UPI0038571847